jgi:hypothetical protein
MEWMEIRTSRIKIVKQRLSVVVTGWDGSESTPKTILAVVQWNGKRIKVDYYEESARTDAYAQEVIEEAMEDIMQIIRERDWERQQGIYVH